MRCRDVHHLSTGGARAAAALPADPASVRPLLVTAGGITRAPTRQAWSGAWPIGTGCPTHYTAPAHSRERARPPAVSMTDDLPD